MKMLLDDGFVVTNGNGEYAHASACREDTPNYDLIVLLIESGCPVGDAFPEFVERVQPGDTPPKALQIVQEMLDRDADLEKTYDEEDTIFMLARNVDVLRLLIEDMKKQGLDLLDEENDNGDTVMSLAKLNGDTEIVELLKEEGSVEDEESSSEDDEENEENEENEEAEEPEVQQGAAAAVTLE